MQINLQANSSNQFNKYSDTSVTINNIDYTKNLLVTRNKVIEIEMQQITELDKELINDIVTQHKPDIIIFGSGNKIIMPNASILLALQKQQIGFEVMPIPALCRTFNYLSGEDRNVVALILF